jgi:hypothetical protein
MDSIFDNPIGRMLKTSAQTDNRKMASALRNRKNKLEAVRPGNIFSKRRSFGEDVVDQAVRGQ